MSRIAGVGCASCRAAHFERRNPAFCFAAAAIPRTLRGARAARPGSEFAGSTFPCGCRRPSQQHGSFSSFSCGIVAAIAVILRTHRPQMITESARPEFRSKTTSRWRLMKRVQIDQRAAARTHCGARTSRSAPSVLICASTFGCLVVAVQPIGRKFLCNKLLLLASFTSIY